MDPELRRFRCSLNEGEKLSKNVGSLEIYSESFLEIELLWGSKEEMRSPTAQQEQG